MTLSHRCIRWLITAGLVVVFAAIFGWYKFFREVPQAAFADENERFKYGSIGSENDRGIPYWIWVVLPRVFPDLMPGPGGYKAFGLVWEPGKEIPVGFSKKTIGFPRIANNCAICHVGTYRASPFDVPVAIAAAPAHTSDIQNMIRFLSRCAKDPRFNADTLLAEITREVDLGFVDKLIYRFAIIPLTKKALLEQDGQFAWMNRPGWPQWGKGRDDPMNLTKYFMTSMPMDDTTGQADFPSIWNLKTRKGDGHFLNWSCDTPAVRSVIIDSALGLGCRPGAAFLKRMEEVDTYLSNLPPPKYPFPVDAALAGQGRTIYNRDCANCHEPGQSRTSRPIPIVEIGTDRERMDTWTQAAADEANRRVKDMGIDRPNMVKQEGYEATPLDGLWMRAPYLHNGSVPTLVDLLEKPESRPASFYRGYDVFDPVRVGFVTSGPEAEREGWKLDTRVRGDGNQGHLYGTDLPAAEKTALVEYLKTL
jgi:mono/diheme cytochrome c family protein